MTAMDMNNQEFEIQVADGLDHIWDFAYLGRHPLAQLECVKQRMPQRTGRSHVEVGRAVSILLRDAIKSLQPMSEQMEFSREKHYYTILYKAYIEGINNKVIASSLDMGERTLYRYSIKAIQVVAQILADWEK